MEGRGFVVQNGTVTTINDNLRVGGGSFWEDDYTDENNVAQHRLRANLSFMSENTLVLSVRVHAGQEVVVGGARFKVLEIMTAKRSYLRLEQISS